MKTVTFASLFRNAAAVLALAASALACAGGTVVYHINDAANARALLNNVNNHLNAAPDTTIHVVSHGKGIDFLLKDAADANGRPFAAGIQTLNERGVRFKVCRNTLQSRALDDSAVAAGVGVVPSGVAEVARLQLEEKAAYLKP